MRKGKREEREKLCNYRNLVEEGVGVDIILLYVLIAS